MKKPPGTMASWRSRLVSGWRSWSVDMLLNAAGRDAVRVEMKGFRFHGDKWEVCQLYVRYGSLLNERMYVLFQVKVKP